MQFSSSSKCSPATMVLAFALLLGITEIVTAWQISSVTMTRMTTNLRMSSQDGKSSTSSTSTSSGLSHSSTPSPNYPSQPSPSLSSLVPNVPRRRSKQLHKDVVIVGGGLAGLSTALYLTQIDPERRITILDKNEDSNGKAPSAGNMASMAAAGMLAPNSERLPRGEYRDLCMASRRMYADFTALVEGMAQESGSEGLPYLPNKDDDDDDDDESGLEPWNIGYLASGGFFAPAFAGDSVATWAPPEEEDDEKKTPSAFWLDATQARELEPHLHPDVVGGWWFPEDASVDARRLTCSLKAACVGAGVEFLCGPRNEVTALDLQDGTCKGIWLGSESGRYVVAKAVLVANGAWMRNLLPVPLEPHKGQSLSLRMPKDRPPILKRVLFGGDSYIVPKADGRIVIGATVEAGSFDSSVTPAGIMHVLSYALELVPGLADLPIEETWAGLRPTTPDKGPILGETPWDNLFLAGGYWRNGVLLAPKTGHLLATLIANQKNNNNEDEKQSTLSREDRAMLDAFAWDRFTSPEGGKRMAANSRYAASLYPVHRRKSGTGVAAAVGTELGSYSTARSAGEERQKDRKSMFGSDDQDDSDADDLFEKAAMLGREDAEAFEGLDNMTSKKKKEGEDATPSPTRDDSEKLKFYYSEQAMALGELEILDSTTDATADDEEKAEATIPYDGSADAITVGSATKSSDEDDNDEDEDEETSSGGLESIYKSIRENKAKQEVDLPDQNIKDDRPDPGFRISHVCKDTGKVREIPPYTQPAVFIESLKKEEEEESSQTSEVTTTANISSPKDKVEGSASYSKESSNYDETTYDGYQEIFKANASSSRKEELEKMKLARMKNRSSEPPREVRKKE